MPSDEGCNAAAEIETGIGGVAEVPASRTRESAHSCAAASKLANDRVGVLRGWGHARAGRIDSIDEMRGGIEVLQTTARLRLPYYRELLAEACGWHGRHAEGLRAIAAG